MHPLLIFFLRICFGILFLVFIMSIIYLAKESMVSIDDEYCDDGDDGSSSDGKIVNIRSTEKPENC